MLVFLVPFVIRGCAAIITTSNPNAEDLSQFSRDGPGSCPGIIGWPQVPAPVSCDDPGCRGISWAVPPYRCRQRDGVMFGREVFGCPCCPRLVDCDDPNCDGSPSEEICQSELLSKCVCVSSNRRASLTRAQNNAAAPAAPQVEEGLADLSIYGDTGAISSNSRNCPRNPPVRCLDPQCRGSDDGISDMLSTQDAIRWMASLSSMAPKQPYTLVPAVLNSSIVAQPTATQIQIRLALLCSYGGVSAVGPAADRFSLIGSLPGSPAIHLTFISTLSMISLTPRIFILPNLSFSLTLVRNLASIR